MALVSPTTRYTVQANDQQFGPHTRAEIASMFKAGMIDGTAYVWCEGWSDWKPISAILPSALVSAAAPAAAVPVAAVAAPAAAVAAAPRSEPQPVVPEYASAPAADPARQRTKPRGYVARVGLRSFIFQIALAVWTLSYAGWLISVAASASSHASPGGLGMSSGPPVNPLDLSAGIFSSWICVAGGWCVVGLPLGISAVATMHEPQR